MVSVIRRMTKLRALLAIKLGPGAAELPPNVSKIHMEFAKRINDGHFGPRKFWHTYLPRLKYHNPAVSMTVNRTMNQEGPALMTVHFNDAASSQTPSETGGKASSESTSIDQAERVVTINMKHRHESEILSQLLAVAKAVPINPTPEELEQLRDLEEQQTLSEKDSTRHQAYNEAKKRKEAILAQARAAST